MSRSAPHHADDENQRDLDLIRRIRAGDHEAWTELLEPYQARLFAVCYRMIPDRETAADLTQDAMVRIIQGLAGFDGRSKASTWMIRITMNGCLSHLRKQKHRRHASLDALTKSDRDGGAGGSGGGGGATSLISDADREPVPLRSVELQEEQDSLSRALSSLAPATRAILVLRDVQGLDYEQIAGVLDVAVGTVKSRLFRARVALREAVEKKPPPPITTTPTDGPQPQ